MVYFPNITINDLAPPGAFLSALCVGDFFRFPASAEGAVYIVVERVYDAHPSRPVLTEMRYISLVNDRIYSSYHPEGKRVNVLRLRSAEFDLKGGS